MKIAVCVRAPRDNLTLSEGAVNIRYQKQGGYFDAQLCGTGIRLLVDRELPARHLSIRHEDCPNIGQLSTAHMSADGWFYSTEGRAGELYTVHRCALCCHTITPAFCSEVQGVPRRHGPCVRLTDDSVTSCHIVDGVGIKKRRLVASDEPGTLVFVIGTRLRPVTRRFVRRYFKDMEPLKSSDWVFGYQRLAVLLADAAVLVPT